MRLQNPGQGEGGPLSEGPLMLRLAKPGGVADHHARGDPGASVNPARDAFRLRRASRSFLLNGEA